MGSNATTLDELILETVDRLQESRKRQHIAPVCAIGTELFNEVLKQSIRGFDFPETAMRKLSDKIRIEIKSTTEKLVEENRLFKGETINDFYYKISEP